MGQLSYTEMTPAGDIHYLWTSAPTLQKGMLIKSALSPKSTCGLGQTGTDQWSWVSYSKDLELLPLSGCNSIRKWGNHMWTEHSGNFWILTIHKPVRTLHNILHQFPVLKRSIWTQIVLTFVHLLFLKWSSRKAWCWPFTWHTPGSSDCSTKMRRHLGLDRSPNNCLPSYNVCSPESVSNYPGKLQPWPHPLLRTLLGCHEEKDAENGHQERAFPLMGHQHFCTCGHIYEKWGQGEPCSFHVYLLSTLMFGDLLKASGKERWNKTKVCLCEAYILAEQPNVSISIPTYTHTCVSLSVFASSLLGVRVCLQSNYT